MPGGVLKLLGWIDFSVTITCARSHITVRRASESSNSERASHEVKAKSHLYVFYCSLMISSDGSGHGAASVESKDNPKRILFKIATVEEEEGRRDLIAESIAKGRRDRFNVTLQGERVQNGRPILDRPHRPGRAEDQAKLDTRRLYGYSQRSLRFTSDAQDQSLELGFDEQITATLRRMAATIKLKIEITPAISDQTFIFLRANFARLRKNHQACAGRVDGIEVLSSA